MLIAALIATASAGSIAAPGISAGPDSSGATPNPAAVAYNPAALAAAEGFQFLFDGQVAAVRVDVEATRNGGIDPNTGEDYTLSQARVKAPVAMIAASYQIIPERLTAGLALYNPFTGGADYTFSEENPDSGPYRTHQRYHGIKTTVVSAAISPAVGVTVIDGLHVGAGVAWNIDYISVLKASRINNDEGAPDYSNDVVLDGSATGGHFGWNAGIFFDKYKMAQVGLSYSAPGTFTTEGGEATVSVPAGLTVEGEALTVPADVSVELKLPAILRAWLNSQVTEDLNLGVGWEGQLWNGCCGEQDSDIHTTLLSTDGDPIGPDDGVAIEINPDIYNPRRLWNAFTFAQLGGYQINDKLWGGWQLRYNQNAVPDYAVSATNLDFENAGGQVALRYQVTDAMQIGLSYSKFFLFSREISEETSAWNRGDGNPRFSPSIPGTTSGAGNYSGKVDIFGLRVGVQI